MRTLPALVLMLFCLGHCWAIGEDDAAELLNAIRASDTSDVDRANAFEKIGDIAGDDAIAILTEYLDDEKWSHYARFALQKMEGERVTKALIESMDNLQGDLRIGVISTIGRRRDGAAIGAMSELLGNENDDQAAAVAVALGQIGTTAATGILTKAFENEQNTGRREALAGALLSAGQRLAGAGDRAAAIAVFDQLRTAQLPKAYLIGATENAIRARGADGVTLMVEQLKSSDLDYLRIGLSVSRVLPGAGVTTGIIDTLKAEASPSRQILLIQALKDRGDTAARDTIGRYIGSDSRTVRLAAIEAMGTLGDESSLPLLLATGGDLTDAVLRALVAMKGDGVNARLIEAAEMDNPPKVVVMALGKRRVEDAAELLMQLAADVSNHASSEALAALGTTVPQDMFPDLLGMLKDAHEKSRKEAVRQAITAAIFRSSAPDACAEALGKIIPRSSPADREFLFEQVRIAGGEKAVALMRAYALSSDVPLQDASTKTLGLWLSADAAPVLLEVAKGRGRFANRALGGYIRIFRQFELPEKQRIAMAEQALKVARRPNERNAAISAMTRFPCLGTFDLALGQINVQGSEVPAAKAALTIGRTVLTLDPQRGKSGLQKLVDAQVNPALTASAKALLAQ